MPSPDGAPFRDLLLDPEFWRPRLSKMNEVPRRLLIFPRPDLARPGIEVIELRLRAHDCERLVCILGRPSFCATGEAVQVRICDRVEGPELDWHAIEEGSTDLVFACPDGRRLEDRVLDVLRVAMAAASVESTDWREVGLLPRRDTPKDEQVLADMIRSKGWV